MRSKISMALTTQNERGNCFQIDADGLKGEPPAERRVGQDKEQAKLVSNGGPAKQAACPPRGVVERRSNGEMGSKFFERE
jgi:hypothetical protein